VGVEDPLAGITGGAHPFGQAGARQPPDHSAGGGDRVWVAEQQLRDAVVDRGVELLAADDLGKQVHPLGLGGPEPAPGQQDVERGRLTDPPQARCGSGAGDQTETHLGQAENGVVAGDTDVGGGHDRQSGAERGAVDPAHHGHRRLVDPGQDRRQEVGCPADGRRVGELSAVRARRECRGGAGHEDHPYRRVASERAQGVVDVLQHPGAQGVASGRLVHRVGDDTALVARCARTLGHRRPSRSHPGAVLVLLGEAREDLLRERVQHLLVFLGIQVALAEL
jgi:hypothetical protein